MYKNLLTRASCRMVDLKTPAQLSLSWSGVWKGKWNRWKLTRGRASIEAEKLGGESRLTR